MQHFTNLKPIQDIYKYKIYFKKSFNDHMHLRYFTRLKLTFLQNSDWYKIKNAIFNLI